MRSWTTTRWPPKLPALGNGVVSQQATYAVALLLTDLTHVHTSVFEQGRAG
ncbi:hypothetical protein OG563_33760 [Nocardia vinacea]|uniref:Uncharacterized protein n=1 Tax=Nocardia vinacea TaxID=96468 RepID=A0ABZ1YM09_9NOCA|nr:hypothetical protein [Nocardia vinacea]